MSHDCMSGCTERRNRNDQEGENVKGLTENKAGKKRFKEKKMKRWDSGSLCCSGGLLGWAGCLVTVQAQIQMMSHFLKHTHKVCTRNFKCSLITLTAGPRLSLQICRYLLTNTRAHSRTNGSPLVPTEAPPWPSFPKLPEQRGGLFFKTAVSSSATRLGLLLLMFSENFCHQKEH